MQLKKVYRQFVVMILASVLGFTVFSGGATATASTGEVEGVVEKMNDAVAVALSGVTVTLYSGETGSDLLVDTVVTDNTGAYHFNNVPEGVININFSKSGYIETRFFFSKKVVAGETLTIIPIKLFTTRIGGSVYLGDTLHPISGATIKLTGTSYETTTNVGGDYAFFDVPQGTYSIVVSKNGYVSQSTADFTILSKQIHEESLYLVFSPPTDTGNLWINGKLKASVEDKISSGTATTFSDVPAKNWSSNAIELASKLGFVTGYTDGTFRGDANVTRAEFAAMIVKALGLKGDGSSSFSDTNNSWAKDAIDALKSNGIINGYQDGTFKPNQDISRAELVTILSKIMNIKKQESSAKFSDVSGNWAEEAINVFAALGLATGKGNDKFSPNATATRAESVVMILRVLNKNLELNLDI